MKYKKPTQEMLDFFKKRTKEHINRVVKFMRQLEGFRDLTAEELKERAAAHDRDKYSKELVLPYIWVTEYHRVNNEGAVSEELQQQYDLASEATGKHVQQNRHHPETHESPEDMTELDLAEMVADWSAMAEELGEGSARGWAEKNIGSKWEFSPEQTEFIFDAISWLEGTTREAVLRHAAQDVAYLETIALADIAGHIMDELVDEASPLDPYDYSRLDPIVVAKEEWGHDIVDGFHRTAGLLAWAQEEKVEPTDVQIKVVVATHDHLIGLAAQPGPYQDRALRRIYKDVGIDYTVAVRSGKTIRYQGALYREAYEEPELQHRRQEDQLLYGYVVQFAEEGKNDHYGPHVWTLKTELPEIPDSLVDFTADYFELDPEAAREYVDPDKIVESAGAWDVPEFVSAVWEAFGDPGYKTWDGAVVLDPEAVELEYWYDDPEAWLED